MFGVGRHRRHLAHLSDPAPFDLLAQMLKERRTKNVFYVPGEHDRYDNGARGGAHSVRMFLPSFP